MHHFRILYLSAYTSLEKYVSNVYPRDDLATLMFMTESGRDSENPICLQMVLAASAVSGLSAWIKYGSFPL